MLVRKAPLQAIVVRVEVGADVIRIVGDTEKLETALTGAGGLAMPGVRSSLREWRARQNETANTYVIEVAR